MLYAYLDYTAQAIHYSGQWWVHPRRRGGDLSMINVAVEAFSGNPDSVPGMRRWLCRKLRGHGCAETALLLADELAANAVRHTKGGYTVIAVWDDDLVYVSVTDEGSDTLPGVPCGRPHADGDFEADLAETGRGLLLVRMLSARWGVTETGHGCDVWFEVDQPERALVG